MKKININIKDDYTEYPGLRNSSISEESGEDFYHDLLNEKFTEAYNENINIEINLDGVAGYASSFLDESFGNLVYDFSLKEVKKRVIIISEEEKEWKDMLENKTYLEWEQRRLKNEIPKVTKQHKTWYRLENGKLDRKVWVPFNN